MKGKVNKNSMGEPKTSLFTTVKGQLYGSIMDHYNTQRLDKRHCDCYLESLEKAVNTSIVNEILIQ